MAKYRVLGNREVLGHVHGDEFLADISDIQEQRLVAGGHIERIDTLTPLDFIASSGSPVTVTSKTYDGTSAPDPMAEPVSEELPDDRAGESDQKE